MLDGNEKKRCKVRGDNDDGLDPVVEVRVCRIDTRSHIGMSRHGAHPRMILRRSAVSAFPVINGFETILRGALATAPVARPTHNVQFGSIAAVDLCAANIDFGVAFHLNGNILAVAAATASSCSGGGGTLPVAVVAAGTAPRASTTSSSTSLLLS